MKDIVSGLLQTTLLDRSSKPAKPFEQVIDNANLRSPVPRILRKRITLHPCKPVPLPLTSTIREILLHTIRRTSLFNSKEST
jgi:hypothetical protein